MRIHPTCLLVSLYIFLISFLLCLATEWWYVQSYRKFWQKNCFLFLLQKGTETSIVKDSHQLFILPVLAMSLKDTINRHALVFVHQPFEPKPRQTDTFSDRSPFKYWCDYQSRPTASNSLVLHVPAAPPGGPQCRNQREWVIKRNRK